MISGIGVIIMVIKSTKKTGKVPYKSFSLDGTYYSGSGDISRQVKKDEIIAVYTTRLEEAACVNWHFIGNGGGRFTFIVSDVNGQLLGNAYTYQNDTYNVVTVLDPGDYEVKISFAGSRNDPNGIYRFKAIKKVIPTNVARYLSFIDAKTVSIIGKPYYGKARTTFEILNEDQMFIKRFYLYDENARKIELFLEPGKYFIRANSGQRRGEVYGLRIE